jgi:hypothetical protein
MQPSIRCSGGAHYIFPDLAEVRYAGILALQRGYGYCAKFFSCDGVVNVAAGIRRLPHHATAVTTGACYAPSHIRGEREREMQSLSTSGHDGQSRTDLQGG